MGFERRQEREIEKYGEKEDELIMSRKREGRVVLN